MSAADEPIGVYNFDTPATAGYELNDPPVGTYNFDTPATGTYEFRVEDWTFNGSTEYIGFAGFAGNRRLTQYEPQSYDTPPTAYDNFRAVSGSFWNAIAIRI